MNNMHKNEKGFGVVEVMLVVVIVALIGVVGWLVYKGHHQATINTSTTSSEKPSTITKTSTNTPTQPVNSTASWYLYTSPGNSYTMRIPDGWNLEQNGTNSDAEFDPLLLYSGSGNTLAIKQGTPGIVTPQPGVGRDAPPTLNVQWCPASDTSCPISLGSGATQQTSLKTSSGLTIDKYYFYEAQPSTNISDPPQGTEYTYIIKNSSSELWTTYYFAPGQTDYHTNVEEALETVQLN